MRRADNSPGCNPGNTSISTFFKLRRSDRIPRKRTSRHAMVGWRCPGRGASCLAPLPG
jgi:hypothetical protein